MIGLGPQCGRLHHRDGFDATRDDHIHMGHNDLFGGTCYRHEAGGALPVDRHARDGDGQTCEQCSCAADRMLYAWWLRRTEDDGVELRRIDARTFDSRADRMWGMGWRGLSVASADIVADDRGGGWVEDDGHALV